MRGPSLGWGDGAGEEEGVTVVRSGCGPQSGGLGFTEMGEPLRGQASPVLLALRALDVQTLGLSLAFSALEKHPEYGCP